MMAEPKTTLEVLNEKRTVAKSVGGVGVACHDILLHKREDRVLVLLPGARLSTFVRAF